MVHVFKVVFFLVILLFALASTGFSISDAEISSDSESSSESISDSESINDSEIRIDPVVDNRKIAEVGVVIQDPFCGTDDFGPLVALAPQVIWETMILYESDCNTFDTTIKCSPSEIGACKMVDSIPVTIVGPRVLQDDSMPNKYTLHPLPFSRIAAEGATRIIIIEN